MRGCTLHQRAAKTAMQALRQHPQRLKFLRSGLRTNLCKRHDITLSFCYERKPAFQRLRRNDELRPPLRPLRRRVERQRASLLIR